MGSKQHLKSKTRRVVNRVTTALRMCAFGVTNAHGPMGEYARRMKGRLGKVEGTTAVAHKIARLIYAMLKTRTPYDAQKAFKPNSYSQSKKMKTLKKLAKSLNFEITPKRTESTS